MTGMGRTLVVDEMVKVVSDNHGTAPPCRDPKCVDLYTTGAPGAYATADVEPPSSRDAAWKRGDGLMAADMHRGVPVEGMP